VPGDWNAFFVLALDNTTLLVILSSLLIGAFKFPPDLVLGRIVPGTAAGVLVGDLAYTWLAVRLARASGRDDVTAMAGSASTRRRSLDRLRRSRTRHAGHGRSDPRVEDRHGCHRRHGRVQAPAGLLR